MWIYWILNSEAIGWIFKFHLVPKTISLPIFPIVFIPLIILWLVNVWKIKCETVRDRISFFLRHFCPYMYLVFPNENSPCGQEKNSIAIWPNVNRICTKGLVRLRVEKWFQKRVPWEKFCLFGESRNLKFHYTVCAPLMGEKKDTNLKSPKHLVEWLKRRERKRTIFQYNRHQIGIVKRRGVTEK